MTLVKLGFDLIRLDNWGKTLVYHGILELGLIQQGLKITEIRDLYKFFI